MIRWAVLYNKEMVEMRRNFKWVWIPLVFVLFGILQPVTTYYMPLIMESTGSIPKEAIELMPVMSAEDVMVKTMEQYGTLGVLILVLAFMGIVSGERTSGVASLILVKPVSFAAYITAKWAAAATLTLVSLLAGFSATWYYTDLLIGRVPFGETIAATLTYFVWMLVIITLTLLLSTWLKSSGGIAFLSIVIVTVLSIVTGLYSKYLYWSPSRLSVHAGSILSEGTAGSNFLAVLITSLLLIAFMLAGAVYLLRNKELPD